jgi:hypothetical protein
MRFIFLIPLVLVVLGMSACQSGDQSSPENDKKMALSGTSSSYANHGVSFSIPKGWAQMELPIPGEQGESIGAYIMVEKEGEDESGQFIASLLDTKIPLKEYMDLVKNQLLQSLSSHQSKVNFSEVSEEDFNGAKAVVCKFDHNAADLNFQGELKAFYCGEKTVQIFIQEEKSDAPKNKTGLDLLVSSFKCK